MNEQNEALKALIFYAVVSGRGGERDGVREHSVAGGDAVATVSAPRPHLRGALRAAQGDRTTDGGLVSGIESVVCFHSGLEFL